MDKNQQLTYGVVSEGVFAESLRKFCGKFADNTFYCARKGCGNSAESLRKFHGNLRKMFCNDPFPNDPISVVLKKVNILRNESPSEKMSVCNRSGYYGLERRRAKGFVLATHNK